MRPATTRTLNPLPFQDLEPHRFEDLVRQLAYDYRRWKSLEATGRSGSDDGLDIRASELVFEDSEPEANELGESNSSTSVVGERSWIFQCKREKSLGPGRIRGVVNETLRSLTTPPFGFVLAVACDVSKKARDEFRNEMVTRGVEEFVIWAKGELEDMLFQPKNDRLLFAYFGISLQTRRRSLATVLRSNIAKKKQLLALIGDENPEETLLLLRDPSDERYPNLPKEGEPRNRWVTCRAVHLKVPGCLTVVYREHLAALTPDRDGWDALFDNNYAEIWTENHLRSLQAWGLGDSDFSPSPHGAFWSEFIAKQDRAILKEIRFVPFDQILAIDPVGDGHFPIPQIMVDFNDESGPFKPRVIHVLEHEDRMFGGEISLQPEEDNRVAIFPKVLPGESDPVPPQFDHTSNKVLPLLKESEEKLSDILQGGTEHRKDAKAATQDEAKRLAEIQSKMLPYQNWRDQIALPLFSAFVVRLRSAGHQARVVISPGPHEKSTRHDFGSCELKIKLHSGSSYNPSFRLSGFIRVSMSAYSGWNLDMEPSRKESDRTHPAATRTPIEAMPKELLEAEVLGMLERLKSRG